jgi:hypothetical protein
MVPVYKNLSIEILISNMSKPRGRIWIRIWIGIKWEIRTRNQTGINTEYRVANGSLPVLTAVVTKETICTYGFLSFLYPYGHGSFRPSVPVSSYGTHGSGIYPY